MNTTFPVTGMTCEGCAGKVQRRLAAHESVRSATVTLNPPRAAVESDAPLSAEELNRWLAEIGKYRLGAPDAASGPEPAKAPAALPEKNAATYRPLLILLGYLLAVTAAALVAAGGWDASLAMRLFMGGFFIAFSFFKMLNLRGFVDAYRGYDLVAKAWTPWGWIYPFVELGLGLAYIGNVAPFTVNLVTAVVMAVSLAGVLKAVLSKRAIRCACLGTVFNLPMSTVTIVEDGLMLVMALGMLAMG